MTKNYRQINRKEHFIRKFPLFITFSKKIYNHIPQHTSEIPSKLPTFIHIFHFYLYFSPLKIFSPSQFYVQKITNPPLIRNFPIPHTPHTSQLTHPHSAHITHHPHHSHRTSPSQPSPSPQINFHHNPCKHPPGIKKSPGKIRGFYQAAYENMLLEISNEVSITSCLAYRLRRGSAIRRGLLQHGDHRSR